MDSERIKIIKEINGFIEIDKGDLVELAQKMFGIKKAQAFDLVTKIVGF